MLSVNYLLKTGIDRSYDNSIFNLGVTSIMLPTMVIPLYILTHNTQGTPHLYLCQHFFSPGFLFVCLGIGAYFVSQGGLELTILLPLPPEGWDYRSRPPRSALFSFFWFCLLASGYPKKCESIFHCDFSFFIRCLFFYQRLEHWY